MEFAEYNSYKVLEHWRPVQEILLVEQLIDGKNGLSSLFSYLYLKTKKEYSNFQCRKDGSDPFIHPLNVVYNLKRAGVNDYILFCAGLVHDLIEEKVDDYKKKNNLKEEGKDIATLDEYELKMFDEFEQDLLQFAGEFSLQKESITELMEILRLLTRHKRDLYYKSISAIFNYSNHSIKEKAIMVKLADRIHNIQCLDNHNSLQKTYQCFKNLFILNNTKSHLIKSKINPNLPLDKLFKKCGKATYDSFLRICHESLGKNIYSVESMLHLSFRKFLHEQNGLECVTNYKEDEKHPLGLYHGILLKYDTRLHQEWTELNIIKDKETLFYEHFFKDYNFSTEQIQAIVDYKDAYALKEVVSYLLYKKDYFISGFACANLCRRGMKCMRC